MYEWMDMAKRPKRQAGTQTDVTQIDRHTDGQRDGRKESKRCQTNRHSRSVRGGQDDRKRGSTVICCQICLKLGTTDKEKHDDLAPCLRLNRVLSHADESQLAKTVCFL